MNIIKGKNEEILVPVSTVVPCFQDELNVVIWKWRQVTLAYLLNPWKKHSLKANIKQNKQNIFLKCNTFFYKIIQ